VHDVGADPELAGDDYEGVRTVEGVYTMIAIVLGTRPEIIKMSPIIRVIPNATRTASSALQRLHGLTASILNLVVQSKLILANYSLVVK
jgi:hypothetical protein